MLVAVVMLFVIGAMAALSIDVVTLYTARSEAQLAADGAALAGARVLANSGMTSDPNAASDGLMTNAQGLAQKVAIQVAQSNTVGGAVGDIVVGFNGSTTSPCVTLMPVANPCITVQVQRTDLPTFFARIWGRTTLTVRASATAEAYNPSNVPGISVGGKLPVAPICVKPWLLPNIDPISGGAIFDTTSGAITATTLLGGPPPGPTRLKLACGPTGDCTTLPKPQVWQYYPGDPVSFPAPTTALPTCNPVLTTAYQESVAGCIQTPISCNSQLNIDMSDDDTRNSETADAVNCLTHASAGEGDAVDLTAAAAPSPPFQFLVGADNPIAVVNTSLADKDVMVSDSLVTVPVFNSGDGTVAPSNPVQIVGFVQLFLSPQGTATPPNSHMKTTVINMAGCGTVASGQPILGNGASPVAVRLISPQLISPP